jgi:hypothetical protein
MSLTLDQLLDLRNKQIKELDAIILDLQIAKQQLEIKLIDKDIKIYELSNELLILKLAK